MECSSEGHTSISVSGNSVMAQEQARSETKNATEPFTDSTKATPLKPNNLKKKVILFKLGNDETLFSLGRNFSPAGHFISSLKRNYRNA